MIGALAVLAALLAAISYNAWRAAAQRADAEIWYVHTMDVLLATSNVKAAIHSELRGERGYLLTHNERFLEPYDQGRRSVRIHLLELASLTRDNSRQQHSLRVLRNRIERYEALLEATIALERRGAHAQAIRVVRAGLGRQHIELVLATIARMDERERSLLVARRARAEAAMFRNDRAQYALSLFGLVLLGVAGWAVRSARAAQRLAAAVTEELRVHATTDALTGVANRRSFLAALEAQARDPAAEPAALAILDIDHFKRVNDGYGHPAGDTVLRAIADAARAAVRGSDLVGRLGGEEFGILMPRTSVAQASAVCERLRTAVRELAVPVEGGRAVRITLSVGVARQLHGEPVDALIHRADKALYDAKRGGRDRVLLAA